VSARGTVKATGKIKAAVVSGIALNYAFHGQTFAAGVLRASLGEAHTVPTTPYEVTIAPPSSGTFDKDLGVLNGTTGLPLTRVAMSPATGQYSVDETTGIYTFAAADTTVAMTISYAYAVASTGQKITINQQPIGTNPTFQLDYVSTLYGVTYYVRMFRAVASKLTRAHKLTDFMMPEIDFAFYADNVGKVYEVTYDTAA